MIAVLILLPMCMGLLAFWWKPDPTRRALLAATAALHTTVVAALWWQRTSSASYMSAPPPGAWIGLDATGLLFLSIVSLLFLASALYSTGYLWQERRSMHVDPQENLFFINEPEAVYTGCMLLFLGSMTLVTVSQHFGLLWVGIETTTLASAPLIYFHRHHRSLEAAWKYLLICSVGIALALLGNFLLAVASSDGVSAGSGPSGLVVAELMRDAKGLHTSWLKAAFLFFLVGYGTKMGLAPLHTWLPDAHSESPSAVSALLSGALLNCAFLGILRAHQVCVAAGVAEFSQELLIGFGLLSMVFAAVFILGQIDYKRMLAYSSVEHMGILALGVGLGGIGAYGAMFHALNHSLTKAALFLLAGNLLGGYHTKVAGEVRGAIRALPMTGLLWVAGFLAITGSPPFSPFLSELTILKAALDQGRGIVAVAYLALLALIFIGMADIVLPMAQRDPAEPPAEPRRREAAWSIQPPALLLLVALVLGVYMPPALNNLLHQAAQALGGR
jgi:hydrogenase-4 component F